MSDFLQQFKFTVLVCEYSMVAILSMFSFETYLRWNVILEWANKQMNEWTSFEILSSNFGKHLDEPGACGIMGRCEVLWQH